MNSESSNNNARPSFFDDDDPTLRFDFHKPSKQNQKDLSKPPILKNALTKFVSGAKQESYYALHERLLTVYKTNSYKVPELVLDLGYAKIKMLEPKDDNLYGFQILKNNINHDFYSPSKSIVDEWYTALKGACVLTSFHEDYKALKMIGKGSFAKVYLVEAKVNGKMYAVKAFTKESVISSNKANAKPSMLNEIDIMRSLDHENIIKLYEVHESEKSIYLVLELIQGKSLQDVLKKPNFREECSEVKMINMIRSILDALAYLAAKGIMHRDLKPDNILIDKDGKVKIADFGLATFVDVPEYIFKKCGTPGYIAPEVFKYDHKNPSTNYDHQCDVFSAGCILYYFLFGTPFFEAPDASEILKINRKFTSEFVAIDTIKLELKNSKSKINKDGLTLLSQLVEFDQKRRITAAESLSYPYFTPVPNGMSKLPGSNDMISDPNKSPNKGSSPRHSAFGSDQIFANSPRMGESPRSAKIGGPKERFANKDSLYLDVGRPELNGKIDTLNGTMTATSNNNSLLINRRDSNASIGSQNHDSYSAFSNKNSAAASPEKRSRSFRIHNNAATGNQSVLKAALLRNMQKNNSDHPQEENKDDGLTSPETKTRSPFGRGSNFSSERGSDVESEDESSESPKLKGFNKDQGNSTPKKRFQPFAQKSDGFEAK